MRLLLSQKVKENEYFLHADMWNTDRFPIKGKVINTGLGEANLLNIAGGLASQGHTVWIYGVAGFIIHRLEQLKFSCKHFGGKTGKIIICNAGRVGYDNLGIGHKLDDDKQIMEMYDIGFSEVDSIYEMGLIVDAIQNDEWNGVTYLQLGADR